MTRRGADPPRRACYRRLMSRGPAIRRAALVVVCHSGLAACGPDAKATASATEGTSDATGDAMGTSDATGDVTAGDACPPEPACRDQPLDPAGLQAGIGGFGVVVEPFVAFSIEALGDVNGDGFADFGLSGFVIFGGPDPAALTDEPAALAARGFPIPSPSDPAARLDPRAVGDVNGDGRDDILVHEYGSSTAWLVHGKDDLAPVDLTLVAAGDGGFVIAGVEGIEEWHRSDRPGVDVDGDGLADLAVNVGGGAKILRGQADGAPIDALSVAPLVETSFAYELSAGDFDDDGVVEVVVCGDAIEVLRAPEGWDAPARATTTLTGTSCDKVRAGDLDGDGHDDLVLASEADYEIVTRIVRAPLPLEMATVEINDECYVFTHSLAFADIDGDGDAELLTVGFDGLLLAGYVEGYAPVLTDPAECEEPLCTPPPAVIAGSIEFGFMEVRSLGDVDGDGRDDVFVFDANAVITRACEPG